MLYGGQGAKLPENFKFSKNVQYTVYSSICAVWVMALSLKLEHDIFSILINIGGTQSHAYREPMHEIYCLK